MAVEGVRAALRAAFAASRSGSPTASRATRFLERLQGIRELHVDGPVARLLLDGSPDRLVKELANHTLVDLTSHEPDLEDVFLSYYTDAEQRSGEDG